MNYCAFTLVAPKKFIPNFDRIHAWSRTTVRGMDEENRYEFPLWADVAYTTLLFHAELEKLTKNMKNAEHLFQSLPRWCLWGLWLVEWAIRNHDWRVFYSFGYNQEPIESLTSMCSIPHLPMWKIIFGQKWCWFTFFRAHSTKESHKVLVLLVLYLFNGFVSALT